MAVSNKYMNTICVFIKKIQRSHCRGLMPLPLLLRDMKFVHTLVGLLNEKLQKPEELPDRVTEQEQLFGGACCFNIDEQQECVVEENECSDLFQPK